MPADEVEEAEQLARALRLSLDAAESEPEAESDSNSWVDALSYRR